jgi:adenylate cyclase class 2
MKEVEILVEVLDDKETALRVLEKFDFKGSKEVLDIYYYDPLRENLQLNEGCYPQEWFRLRKKDNKYLIAYKKDVFQESCWLYSEEDETEIGNFEVAKEIIKNLGFKELIRIDNIKHTFENNLYEIVLEEVKGLGLFLEVERLNVADDEEIKGIRKEIQKFLDSLGINLSNEVNAGKPELMIKKLNEKTQ